jgi:hypothetical protein
VEVPLAQIVPPRNFPMHTIGREQNSKMPEKCGQQTPSGEKSGPVAWREAFITVETSWCHEKEQNLLRETCKIKYCSQKEQRKLGTIFIPCIGQTLKVCRHIEKMSPSVTKNDSFSLGPNDNGINYLKARSKISEMTAIQSLDSPGDAAQVW